MRDERMDKLNRLLNGTDLRIDTIQIDAVTSRTAYMVLDGDVLLATGLMLQDALENTIAWCRRDADSLADAMAKAGFAEKPR